MPDALLQALAPLLVAYFYARRCRALARRGTPVPVGRRTLFYSGVALVLLAAEPPLGTLDDELLSVHMTQHVLLGDLAPLLIVLGLTGPVLAPLLRLTPVGRLRALAHPAVALPVWAVDLYVWHLPVLYQAARAHDAIHALEHACFLGFGIAMWMPLLGPLPVPRWFGNSGRLLYVIGVRLISTLLANVFLWLGHIVYPDYAITAAREGVRPLTDQIIAGAVLMIEGSVVTLCLLAWLFFQAAQRSEASQELLDYAAREGVALNPERAARAAAAGRADLLRERLAAETADRGR